MKDLDKFAAELAGRPDCEGEAAELKDVREVVAERKAEALKNGRREFLFRLMGLTTAGVYVNVLGGGRALASPPPEPEPAALQATPRVTHQKPEGYSWDDHLWAYMIDTHKCIGCGMCVRACKAENDVPDHSYRTWIERYLIDFEDGEFRTHIDSPNGGLYGFQPTRASHSVNKGFFVPKMCNHCAATPCTQVCPVGASYSTKDGVVLVDAERCIGCGYCIQACPYGSRFLDPKTHTASKCTWCYHRITKGLKPACVLACPTGTRLFGDLKRADDPVLEALSQTRVQVLQPQLLTKPRCYYIGLDMEVR